MINKIKKNLKIETVYDWFKYKKRNALDNYKYKELNNNFAEIDEIGHYQKPKINFKKGFFWH